MYVVNVVMIRQKPTLVELPGACILCYSHNIT